MRPVLAPWNTLITQKITPEGGTPMPRLARSRGLSGLFAVSCLLPSTLAFAGADLGWDLSYQAAIQAMDAREFLPYWLSEHPRRPVHTKIQAYVGDTIEGSVLIETPDGYAGSPVATWFIRTRNSAVACTFRRKSMDKPCEPLNPKKMDQFIRELRGFVALPAPKDPSRAAVGKSHGDQPAFFFNYVGFLSIYQHGTVLQRPIAMVERLLPTPDAPPGLDPRTGRLDHAIARLVLADKALKKYQAEIEAWRRRSQLTEAVRQGKLNEVTRLLDQGVPLSFEAWETPPLLAVAAGQGQAAMVKLLLKRGAKINAMESAALKAAVHAKDMPMVTLLLDRGAKATPPKDDLNAYRYVNHWPLGLAMQSGQFDMAKYMISRGADIDLALGLAVQTGQIEMAKQLIDEGADVNHEPLLFVAADKQNLRMVDFLLERGANPNGMDRDHSTTPLITLMRYSGRLGGLPPEAEALQQIGMTEVRLSLIARHLVAKGANVNLTTRSCKTAYLEASDYHSTTMTALLLELGADPKAHEACKAARMSEARKNPAKAGSSCAETSVESRDHIASAGPICLRPR
ncbi:MAG: ankyrin repeat domain-containing protein [Pseudomonadota bacterium]